MQRQISLELLRFILLGACVTFGFVMGVYVEKNSSEPKETEWKTGDVAQYGAAEFSVTAVVERQGEKYLFNKLRELHFERTTVTGDEVPYFVPAKDCIQTYTKDSN